jgi:hypothetical protein
MMNYEEFSEFYNQRGYCPNDVGRRKNPMNEKQLRYRFKKYEASELKRFEAQDRYREVDQQWIDLKKEMDLTKCRLATLLLEEEHYDFYNTLKSEAGHLFSTIDPAHVFGKGAYPHMKYELRNVVPLNRFSHSCLDTSRHPITGKPISREERDKWWEYIITPEEMEYLRSLI